MYLPYLRGRQFELLAIRELIENDLIGSKVIPIVEPVRPSSTLNKTINLFIEKDKKIAIIHNPQVGTYHKALSSLSDSPLKESLLKSFDNKQVIFTHILNKHSGHELIAKKNNSETIIILNDRDYINDYFKIFNNEKPKFTLIPDASVFRRKIKENSVLLEDRFSKKRRNVDYSNVEDEPYSDDHLYYIDDGYVGFSDFSIVGSEFLEAGFAPYAVVIHMVYFDEDQSLRIKHFVSDSNEDISDPAGKFYEALEKLIAWQDSVKLNTHGMNEFVNHYNDGTYPGLGTIKKLSIMHHIELINKFLEE